MAERKQAGLFHELQEARRCLIGLFRAYFAQQTDHPNFLFDNQLKDSRLWIGDQYPTDLGETDLRPAIITSRGEFSRENTGIGDGLVDYDVARGDKIFTRPYVGVIVARCVAPEGLEAEQLAWIVEDLVNLERVEIIKRSPISEVLNTSIGAESPYESNNPELDWVEVPVQIQIRLQYSYTVTRDAPVLEEIGINIR
jgi:hypothetical protein